MVNDIITLEINTFKQLMSLSTFLNLCSDDDGNGNNDDYDVDSDNNVDSNGESPRVPGGFSDLIIKINTYRCPSSFFLIFNEFR